MNDLIGMELEEAKALLLERGIHPEVLETAPYPKDITEGTYRVIKQEILADVYRLIVCRIPDSFR
jgi:hypothetical protein